MSLCPISHWRHGSTAPSRALSPDEKRARYWELRASHKRVMLSREIHAGALMSDRFYREALFDVGEPLPSRANMRGYDVSAIDRGGIAAEDVRVHDETEASRA